ncbi:hypothetical protein EDB19DRAFT_1607023, partial [Suillus lakei]
PTGWTAKIIHPEAVKKMLHYSTGLTATVELSQVQGWRYIFLSGKDYYIWNTTSEQGWRIINVTSREELYSKM